jgi:hypothetical protein
VYDSPATTGFSDSLTGTCFTSDCFGAPLTSPELVEVEDIAALPADDLLAGQRIWVTADSPWVAGVDRTLFRSALEPLRKLDPPLVLSTHLPPARGAITRLLDMLAAAPDADAFVGPDQAALEQMLAQMEPVPAQVLRDDSVPVGAGR